MRLAHWPCHTLSTPFKQPWQELCYIFLHVKYIYIFVYLFIYLYTYTFIYLYTYLFNCSSFVFQVNEEAQPVTVFGLFVY
jgi:hypothetical protein